MFIQGRLACIFIQNVLVCECVCVYVCMYVWWFSTTNTACEIF